MQTTLDDVQQNLGWGEGRGGDRAQEEALHFGAGPKEGGDVFFF